MDDTISRQAALDELKDMYHAAQKWGEEASDDVIKARAESCMASLTEMKLRIEKLPSAQRKEGRWVEHRDYPELAYLCSECGYFTTVISNYCPHCGAKMGG